ncbi:MAG: patatin-like phospholipase family protein [Chitinivibrionales bacterium]|nr:patatin-like phospholipase family protein [Chitinivibrionales bacterium]
MPKFLKKILLLQIILSGLINPVSAKPHLALVLSGGGARGLAQIGCLKALEEAHIKPDLIVATSMGAVIGSLYACGYSVDSIARIAHDIDWNRVLSNAADRRQLFVSQKTGPVNYLMELRLDYNFVPILPTSLSNGQTLYDWLLPKVSAAQIRAQGNFDSLPVPLRIVTTDIVSGRQIVLSSGDIAWSVRAACSVPLVFSPVKMDDMLLMDGGLIANIPVSAAREEGPDYIIAIDVTSALQSASQLDNPARLMGQVVDIEISRRKENEKQLADIVIAPDLGRYGNTDFSKIDSLIGRGYGAMRASIEKIKVRRDTASCSPKPLLKRAPLLIGGFKYRGNERTDARFIRSVLSSDIGDTVKAQTVAKNVSALYATNLFENVSAQFDSAGTLHFVFDEKKYWRVHLGLRYDESRLGEGYIEPAYENLFGRDMCASAYIQYGLRREKYALDFSANHLFSRMIATTLEAQGYIAQELLVRRIDKPDSQTYELSEQSLRKAGVMLLLGTQVGKFSMIEAGIRAEQFTARQSSGSVFLNPLNNLENGLRFVLARLTIDDLDKFPFPKNGRKHYISIGGAPAITGNDQPFAKADGSFSRYLTFGNNHTFFGQALFAWASDSLPAVERVYVGGVKPEERFRDIAVYNYIPFVGLAQRALVGDVMGILHGSYRYCLQRDWYLNADVDIGYVGVYANTRDLTLQKVRANAPVGVGIGAAYASIVGPVRFSWGRLVRNPLQQIASSNIFYLSLGYDF